MGACKHLSETSSDTFLTQVDPPLDRQFDTVAQPWLVFYRCFITDSICG